MTSARRECIGISITTARAGVPRKTVWLAAGWGVVTVLAAVAQYEMRPGSWITVLHVITGVGAIGWGESLLLRARHVAAATDKITIHDAAVEFLEAKRIAVTGVSRHASDHGSNVVYRRLRERGVHFTTEPINQGWGSSAIFDDTCGNLINLAQVQNQ